MPSTPTRLMACREEGGGGGGGREVEGRRAIEGSGARRNKTVYLKATLTRRNIVAFGTQQAPALHLLHLEDAVCGDRHPRQVCAHAPEAVHEEQPEGGGPDRGVGAAEGTCRGEGEGGTMRRLQPQGTCQGEGAALGSGR